MRQRKRKGILAVSPLLVVAFALTFLVQAQVPDQQAGKDKDALRLNSGKALPSYKEGEVLVVFRQGVSAYYARSISESFSMNVVKTYPALSRVQGKEYVFLRSETQTTEQMQETLGRLAEVEIVSPNFLWTVDITIPNDTRFNELWGMHNTGQSGGTPDIDIDAPEAWDIATGSSGVLVGVIDTGIDYNHPDLIANVWQNPGEIPGNGIDDDGNGFIDDVHGINAITMTGNPMDDHGHGTHCSGTIGGVGNNSLGVAGVNWDVGIIGCKFLNSGGFGYTSDAVTCVDYLTDLKTTYGYNVVASNNSWGGGGYDAALKSAIDAMGTAGIIFCAAAGNAGTNNDTIPHYPSSYTSTNLIAVTAVDRFGSQHYNYGATSVDIAAPGLAILSTVNGGYQSWNGTSMATPHVTGAVALAAALFPSETVSQRITRILESAVSLPSLAGKCVTEGMLNLYGALTYSPGAEINVRLKKYGLADGSTTDFGVVLSSAIMGKDIPFKIDNLGSVALNLTGIPAVTLSGAHAAYFYVSQQPSTPVAPGGTATFKVRTKRDSLPPAIPVGWEYAISFSVNIPNDDADENPYNFTIQFTLKKD